MNFIKRLLKCLPGISWLLDLRKELSLIRFQATQQTRIQQQLYRQILRKASMQEGYPFPAAYEHQTFSQNGEDGILREILRRIKIEKGFFVEIGSETVLKTIPDSFWRQVGKEYGLTGARAVVPLQPRSIKSF